MAIVLNGDTGISGIGALSGVTTVSSSATNTPVVLQDSGSNTNTCRAWVNFNGTGTVAIRASFNVSSITDNGTGLYTVNFTNAFADTSYSVSGVASRSGTTGLAGAGVTVTDNSVNTARTTSAIQVIMLANAGDGAYDIAVDSAYVNISVFR